MVGLLHLLPLAAMAHASFARVPSGNGYGTVVYDVSQRRVVGLREHVYQSVDQGVPTRDLLHDTYFGVRAAGQGSWLTGTPVTSVALDGGVITTVQQAQGLRATQTTFAPLGVAAPSLVMVLEVKNEGTAPLAGVHVFTLHNLHIGDGSGGTQGQRVDWDGGRGAYVERSLSSQRVVLIRPLVAPSHRTVTPQNPFALVEANTLFGDVDSSGDGNDIASGFQFDAGTLAPGASFTVGVVLAYHPFGDVAGLDAMTAPLSGKTTEAVTAERAAWAAWLDGARYPEGLSSDERRIYRQQLAVLRMAQSREPIDVASKYFAEGQIVASLRPGQWDIAWVRDGCYAIAALARAGKSAEAQRGLEFMLRAEAGLYQGHVGRPYRISVVRYFGKGKEESDSDGNGPNIEFDGFGLFLWATGQYLDSLDAGDERRAFLDRWATTLFDGVADVLVSLVDQTGLLAADSSIWESHWDNGGRKRYTFSSLWGVVGLLRAASWADGRDGVKAASYRAAAGRLQGAIAGQLVVGGVLRPAVEQPTLVDASVLEAFNHDVLPPGGAVATATLDLIEKRLAVASGHGYKRNENGGTYDEREWIFVDLRMATALRRAGRGAAADALWGWVRDQALVNHDLLPELYDQVSADYAGETPMAGFGAGAYVLGAWDRAAELPGSDGGTVISDGGAGDGGTTTKPGGCSCAVGGSRDGDGVALGVALLALLLWWRRR